MFLGQNENGDRYHFPKDNPGSGSSHQHRAFKPKAFQLFGLDKQPTLRIHYPESRRILTPGLLGKRFIAGYKDGGFWQKKKQDRLQFSAQDVSSTDMTVAGYNKIKDGSNPWQGRREAVESDAQLSSYRGLPIERFPREGGKKVKEDRDESAQDDIIQEVGNLNLGAVQGEETEQTEQTVESILISTSGASRA